MANFISYVFVFFVLLVGAIAAYEDFRSGKIRNKLILFGLGSGFFLLLISVLTGALPVDIFWQSLLNAFIALFLGYVLWYFDLWAAGDAKLFFVLALLLPLRFYWRGFLPVFPSLVILINAFTPLLIFIFCQSVFLAAKKAFLFFKQRELGVWLKNMPGELRQRIRTDHLKYLAALAGFFSGFVIFQLVRSEANGFLGRFGGGKWILFFLMAFLGMAFSRIAKNRKALIALAGVLILYLFARWFFYSWDPLLSLAPITGNSVLQMLGFGSLFLIFSFYERSSRDKNLHFAFWLFLGVFLTILLQGSLLRLVF